MKLVPIKEKKRRTSNVRTLNVEASAAIDALNIQRPIGRTMPIAHHHGDHAMHAPHEHGP